MIHREETIGCRLINADVLVGLRSLPQRKAIGVEINPSYVAMAANRLSKDRGSLLDFVAPKSAEPPRQMDLMEALEK